MAELLPTPELQTLFQVLSEQGFRVIGPTVRDGAIVYGELAHASELPVGWTDKQAPGSYSLVQRGDARVFGYTVGPHSWKGQLFPARERLVQIRRRGAELEYAGTRDEGPALALLGVRACELAGIGVHDAVLTGGPFVDGRYRARRDRCLLIAVNCTEAGALCFCSSMGTGPRAQGAYDLRITELDEHLLIESGSESGQRVLDALPTDGASAGVQAQAEDAVDRCGVSMGKRLDTSDLPARLMGNLDHPHWDELAERCLACGNCTAVCPTCFCFDIRDGSDLKAEVSFRERSWDSCFNADHSTIHGGVFRPSTRDRYQQWATHKFATWTAQFGHSGCVGCGRCIAWCPVGIDVVDAVSTIANGEGAPVPLPAPETYAPGDDDGQVPVPVQVRQVQQETPDVVTLTLQAPQGFRYLHGQFNMLSLPGIGDVPISISGAGEGTVEHTIRAVGAVTTALSKVEPGSKLGLRGPFGSAWPLANQHGRDVVVVAGGIGLAPLRSALLAMAGDRRAFRHVRLLYGTRSPQDIVYANQVLEWMQEGRLAVHVTVDRADADWTGNVGVVTELIRRKHTPADGLYLLCGPEVMMRYCIDELDKEGVPAEQIYLSLERNMKCAVGLCGRCQYGPYFICKDGPVFRYDRVRALFGRRGF